MKKFHKALILGGLFSPLFGAELPLGIIGGGVLDSSTPPYVALVRQDNTLLVVDGLPQENAIVLSASMNQSGLSLIGGGNPNTLSTPPYTALIKPDGQVQAVSGITSTLGVFWSVALNDSNEGILGGVLNGGDLYAVKLDSTGAVEPVLGLPSSGSAQAVAINKSGAALIGGGDNVNLGQLAAFVPVSGSAVLLFGTTPPNGYINAVALNDFDVGLIGGEQGPGANEGYAAIVKADNSVVTLPLNLGANSSINTVALNNSGQGFIGGGTSAGLYLASVDTATESFSEIFVTTLSYEVFSSSINESGVLLAGTVQGAFPLAGMAFFVKPNQEIVFVKDLPDNLVLYRAKINQDGIGLIGGYYGAPPNSPGYAAIVAPDGTATSLTGAFQQLNHGIAGVSMIEGGGIRTSPEAMSGYLNSMNTHISVSAALEAHLTRECGMGQKSSQNKKLALVTDVRGVQGKNRDEQSQYNLWATPFGSFIHQDQDGVNPSYTNDVAGLLIAFDCSYNEFMVGTGIGYAYNYFEYGANLGHGNVQEETLVCYGAFQRKHFWVNAAFWGGIYQLYNKRFAFGFIPSEARTNGWIFAPHMELGLPCSIRSRGRTSFEPFVMVDWLNNWQDGFTETGASGLNLIMQNKYTSLVRVETGARLYENIPYSWGEIIFEEKLSYVNQTPIHFEPMTTSFVASNSTFPIAIGSTQVQNMVGAEFHTTIVPLNQKIPYFSLDLQGNWGNHYQSYYVGLEIGETF